MLLVNTFNRLRRVILAIMLLWSYSGFSQTITINYTGPMEWCAGSNIEIPFLVNGSFQSGNQFVLQLSDSAGNFAFFTELGTLNQSEAGVFGVTIPENSFAGSTYFIRITSSSPVETSTAYGPIRIKNPFANLVAVSNGLVAYYPMDGTGEDRSGFNNHAYFSGGVVSGQNRFGMPGRALEFNGSDGFMIAANSPSLQSPQDEISIAAWLYIRGYQGNWVGVMAKTSANNTGQYNIELNQNGDYRLHFKGTRTSANNPWILNRWTFITVTATRDSMFYYIDGQKVAERNYSQGNSIDTMRLEIGRHRPGGIEYFNGLMDEFRIYNRRITNQEVMALYNESFITTSSPLCVGGEATITFPSMVGASYQWTGPNNFTSTQNPAVIPNLSAANNGPYSVVITAEGCTSAPQQVSITVNEVDPLPAFERNLSACAGDSAAISVPLVNGVSYQWDNPGQFSFPNRAVTRAFVPPGSTFLTLPFTYTSIQTGCQQQDSVVVTVRPLPNAAFTGVDTLICQNSGPFTLTGVISGGIFSGSGVVNNVFSPTSTGLFPIIHTLTENACSASDTLLVRVIDSPDPAFSTGGISSVCQNSEPITLSATSQGGIFSGEGVLGNVFNPLLPGNFIITHRISLAGCADSAQLSIEVRPSPNASFSGPGLLTCVNSASVLIPAVVGGTFSGPFISGNQFIPADTGTFIIRYRVEVDGCADSSQFTTRVVNNPDASFSLAGGDSVCQSELAIALLPAQPGGAFSGELVSGNSFTPSSAGTYFIKYVLNLGACVDSSTRRIVVKPLPNADFSGIPANVCLNQSPITLIPETQGGIFTGNQVSGAIFAPTQAGATQITYSVILAGCEASKTQSVEVRPLPVAAFSGLPDEVCSNAEGTTLFPAIEGGTFLGEGVSGNSFTPAISPGVYQIIYSLTVAGCANADTQQVLVKASPAISVTQRNLTIFPGQTTEPFQIAISGATEYRASWSPTTSLSNANILNPVANPIQSTRYLLTVASNGCSDTASVLVNVSGGLVIPKAFTPNNDGDNDTWVISGLGAFGSHRISVFNRWGNKVFESTSYSNNWDADRLPAGTYYYVIDLDREKRSGTILVIR